MSNEFIKHILPTLNKDAFVKYLFELWQLDDHSDDIDYQKTKRVKLIGEDAFEQHYWKKENAKGIYAFQGYNLITPYFQPIELFSNISEHSFADSELIKKLKEYKLIIDKRESSWQYWTDGTYNMPIIQFVTNFEGIEKDYYYNKIIPSFEHLLEGLDISAETAVGSCDSFFELHRTNAVKAFENFISKYQKHLSISIAGGIPDIEYFTPEKYLTKGLLKNSKNPYEPIFIEQGRDKSEIIKEFEFLIKTDSSESQLELFLKKYYKDIFGEHYERIETQLWLKFPELDITGKNRRLDIFLRNSIERDWELFEIKNTRKIIRTYRDIPTFTAEIHNAIQQLRNYEKLLAQDKVKQKFAKEGIEYFHPELRLVAGTRPDISVEQWRWLKSTNENKLKIITFDELLETMRIRYDLQNNNLTNRMNFPTSNY